MERWVRRALHWILDEPADARVVAGPPVSARDGLLIHISFGPPPDAIGQGLWMHRVERPDQVGAVVELIRQRQLPVDGVVLWGVDTIPSGVEVLARWLSRLGHRLAPGTLWLPGSEMSQAQIEHLARSLRRLGCRVETRGGIDGRHGLGEYRQ